MEKGHDPVRAADARLLAAYAAGDADAARQIVAEHAPKVLSVAMRMLRSQAEAEDVTQEAMLRLWKTAPDWRAGEARISTWLYRVTANLCTDRLRRTRPSADVEPADIADDGPGADAALVAADRQTALIAALAGLPERQRLAVVLRHLEERQNPEIAEIMDLSVEAVESLIARGKRALRGRLEPLRDGLGFEEVAR